MGCAGKTLITIDQLEYLRKRDNLLSALEQGGVDSWEWYGESITAWDKQLPEGDDARIRED